MTTTADSALLPVGPILRHRKADFLPRYAPTGVGGVLAGTTPLGVTSLEGVPTSATVLVRVRAPGRAIDGALVSLQVSEADGTWEVTSSDPDVKYDVLGRLDGECDVVKSDVAPFSLPMITGPKAMVFVRADTRSYFLTAKRGVPPYAFTIESGALPTGFTLDGSTGEVSGTTTDAAGTGTVTFGIADTITTTPEEFEVSFRVLAVPMTAVYNNPDTKFAFAVASTAYVAVNGGVGPYTYAVTAGALPSGLTLNTSTGEITGTTTVDGEAYSFGVTVTDSESTTAVTKTIAGFVGDPHQYWRINVTSAGSHCSVWEIEMASTPSGTNLCTGGAAISGGDYDGSHSKNNAFDGVMADMPWASNNSGSGWIGYAFSSAIVIHEIRIASRNGTFQYPRDFTLEYSDNGSTWTVAATYTGQNSWPVGTFVPYAV